MIEPNWTLLFSKKRGRWWVRLLACGRYHHVKAIAYLPAMRAWLFYDVKFNGTRLMLAREGDPGTRAFLHDYLDSCDLVAMPRLPIPKRVAPHAGFWCTLAMKHLVGIRTGALRPDRLWRDSVAAGGRPYEISPYESSLYDGSLGEGSSEAAPSRLPGPQPSDSVLAFLKAHAQTAIDTIKQPTWLDDAACGRQRSQLVELLHARIRALRNRAPPAAADGLTLSPPQRAAKLTAHGELSDHRQPDVDIAPCGVGIRTSLVRAGHELLGGRAVHAG